MLSLPEMQAAEAWDVRRSLVVLADAIEQTALEVLAKGGAQATCAPPAGGTTAHAIAAKIYGDASRWQDVVSVNGQIRNPLRIGSTTSGPLRVFVPPSRTARGRFA
jgi:prophage DNA circulation protein